MPIYFSNFILMSLLGWINEGDRQAANLVEDELPTYLSVARSPACPGEQSFEKLLFILYAELSSAG